MSAPRRGPIPFVVAGSLVLLVLVTGSRPLDVTTHRAVLRRLRVLAEATADLQKDVLKLRQGELLTYDPLDRDLRTLSTTARELSDAPGYFSKGERVLMRHGAEAVEQSLLAVTEVVEAFKSRNAVLRNSLAYLTAEGSAVCRQAAGGAAADDLNALLRDVLGYSITSREEQAPAIRQAIEALRRGAPAERSLLLDHADMVLKVKPAVDQAVATILSSPLLEKSEELSRDYEAWFAGAQRRVDLCRAALFLVALLAGGAGARLVIRRLERDAALLRRLDAEKNEFLGIAAHDLKNPLGTIVGYTSLLLEDEGMSAEERRGTLRRIAASAQRMLGLIKNVGSPGTELEFAL